MVEPHRRTGRDILLRGARITLTSVVLFAGVAYVADYIALRMRSQPTDSVVVRPVYAVPQKNGRVEYLASDPQPETCVRSLFPHMNDAPCWYLKRHPERRVDM